MMSAENTIKEFPIDVVITWVDGDDPVHRVKRHKYSDDSTSFEDVGGETRFRSIGEIAYCVASINKFAPYVRKIFIVTDNQDPKIGSFIGENFPSHIPMEIVSHDTIFHGYEEYLPVFNSLAIETMLWRIPGLSEHFIYINDDVILVAPTTPQTFFNDGKAVTYGYWHLTFTARMLRLLRKIRGGHLAFTFKDSMVNAINKSGRGFRFHRMRHIPHALRKSVFEEWFAKHPEHLISNISYRFRNQSQFNPQALFYNVALREHKAMRYPIGTKELYLKGRAGNNVYITDRLNYFDSIEGGMFCCVNSLDLVSLDDKKRVIDWLKNKIDLKPYFIDL